MSTPSREEIEGLIAKLNEVVECAYCKAQGASHAIQFGREEAKRYASVLSSMLEGPLTREWQPIETCPKGRKVIAGYFNRAGNWRTITARYYTANSLDDENSESGYAAEGWYEEYEAHEHIYPTDEPPTHWQQLPAPPSPSRSEGHNISEGGGTNE